MLSPNTTLSLDIQGFQTTNGRQGGGGGGGAAGAEAGFCTHRLVAVGLVVEHGGPLGAVAPGLHGPQPHLVLWEALQQINTTDTKALHQLALWTYVFSSSDCSLETVNTYCDQRCYTMDGYGQFHWKVDFEHFPISVVEWLWLWNGYIYIH